MLTIPDDVLQLSPWRRTRWVDTYITAAAGLDGTDRTEDDIASICSALAYAAVADIDAEYYSETPSDAYWKPTINGNARLFNELRATAEAPEWIPYLPMPGTYQHALYGDIVMSRSRAEEFVANFKAGVYQDRIPVDAEHETKVSGAFGWIVDMRVNDDGSADAQVEWLDRGKTMFDENRFRYFSPEWFDTWTDPATGVDHSNIAAGGALTNHPFFKQDSLRPLVASDGVLFACSQPDGTKREAFTRTERTTQVADNPATTTTSDPAQTQAQDPAATTTASEPNQTQSFAEMQRELDTLRSLTQSQATALATANDSIARIQADGRRRQFNDMVLGRGGADDGTPWIGDVEKHVAFMEKLAVQFGEDSEELRSYQEMQRATAAQLKSSNVFNSIGSDQQGGGAGSDSAWAQIESLAKARVAEGHSKSFNEAVGEIAVQQPQLYQQYLDERAGR